MKTKKLIAPIVVALMFSICLVGAILLIISPSDAVPDPYEMLKGKQMASGLWVKDDAPVYFGNGKDISFKYDETTDDRMEASGPMYFGGPIHQKVSTKGNTAHTLTASDSGIILCGNTSGQILTLSNTSLATGLWFWLLASTDPGGNYVSVKATGKTINGANWKNCTTQYGSAYIFYDGSNWQALLTNWS